MTVRDKKAINVKIGERVRTARENAGYTQEELSELLEITPHHMSAVERGISGITIENLQKLCRVTSVSADYILFGSLPEGEEISLANQIASVNPRFKRQVRKVLSALLEISALTDDD